MKTLLIVAMIAWLSVGSSLFAAGRMPVLARVELQGSPEKFPLPARALLRDAAGQPYALVVAQTTDLKRAGSPYRVFDRDASAEAYIIARPRRAGARTAAAGRFNVVEDDGLQWIVRLRKEQDAIDLGDAGFAIARLSAQPLVGRRSAPVQMMRMEEPFTSNGWVAAMMSGVTTNYLVSLMRQVTGDEPAPSGGELRVIRTRHTAASATLNRAMGFCREFFTALGLSADYQAWNAGSYRGTNVVATQTGMTVPGEQVLIVAHLDAMPSSGRAPGADDNASGSCAVLAAAAMLSQYRFERTVRYVLFTGEEQGLYGSAAYAGAAAGAGDNIQAVLNLDMIAWDSTGGPVLSLYTRSTDDPGYAGDLAIAATFTNVVATYGLGAKLQPAILPDSSMIWSDHSSFWDYGYPAILAIEDDNFDFNPYYHSANDTIANINTNYFTAFTQAAVGTIAHLAGPVEQRSFDVVRVVSGDWSATNRSFGASVFHAVHVGGATETNDAFDVTYASLPANTNNAWPVIVTQPGNDDLSTDCRDAASESIFRGDLIMSSPFGTPVSCTNRLRFVFLTPPATNRIYTVRIAADGGFLCVTNLRSLAAGDGFVELPPLLNVTNGAVYGACDLAARFLDYDPARIGLRVNSITDTQVALGARTQIGARTFNEVGVTTNLLAPGSWTWFSVTTNDVAPSAANFEEGWESVPLPADVSAYPNPPALFFRLRRAWPVP